MESMRLEQGIRNMIANFSFQCLMRKLTIITSSAFLYTIDYFISIYKKRSRLLLSQLQ